MPSLKYLASFPDAGDQGSRNVLSVMLKTITVSPPSKNPAPPGDSRLRCQAEGSIISADHAASSSPGKPFHLLPKWPQAAPPSTNLSGGSPLSLAGSSSKTHQLLGTLRPCVLCCAPLVHGDIILRQSINSLWPDITARCPLPDSLPPTPLPPVLWPLFPLGRAEGCGQGAPAVTPQTSFQEPCGRLCNSRNIPAVGISSQKPLH